MENALNKTQDALLIAEKYAVEHNWRAAYYWMEIADRWYALGRGTSFKVTKNGPPA